MMLATLVAISATALTAGLLIPLMRRHAIDLPTHRSSHTDPTPRGGGIAIIVGITAGAATLGSPQTGGVVIFVTALALGAIGLIDDLTGLRAIPRLILQLSLPVAAMWWLLSETPGSSASILVVTIAVIWVAGFVNAFNFMDGINGIAATALAVAGAAHAVIGSLQGLPMLEAAGLVGLGAAAGFLPWNFPRARLFMGDVGSYFAGAWLAGWAVFGIASGVPPIAMLAPMTLFVADTTITLITRANKRERVMEAHREHAYQRVVAAGWTHTQMTAAYAVLSAVIAACGTLWASDTAGWRLPAAIVAAASVGVYLALPRLVDRRNPT